MASKCLSISQRFQKTFVKIVSRSVANLNKLRRVVKCGALANITKLCHGPDVVNNMRVPLNFYLDYPDEITYRFNSQGFRDREWPEHDAAQSIWCVGDSQTLGVGLAFEKIWPSMLQDFTSQSTVNISQLAANNDWIARMAEQILLHVQPKIMVVCWSFISWCDSNWVSEANRAWNSYYTNVKDVSWPTCDDFRDIGRLPADILQEMKTIHHRGWLNWDDPAVVYQNQPKTTVISRATIEQDIERLLGLVQQLQKYASNTKIIYSASPWFAPLEFENIILDSIAEITPWVVDPPDVIDYARDIDHYGPDTAANFAQDLAERI